MEPNSFGSMAVILNFVDRSYIVNMAGNVLLSSVCQFWYVRRTWRLYQRPYTVGAPLAAVAMTVFGLGVTMVARQNEIVNGSISTTSSNRVNAAILSKLTIPRYYYLMSALLDVALTTAIISKLMKMRRDGGGFNKSCVATCTCARRS